jgi:ribosome-binding ATPase
MKAALIGATGSGRKTLMAALTDGDPTRFAPGRRSLATVRVPDPRVDHLSQIFRPQKTTWSTVEVALDDTGSESLAKRLAAVLDAEVLVYVAGAFGLGEDAPGLIIEEVGDLLDEMTLADQMIVEKRLEFFKKIGDKGQERRLFDRLARVIDEGRRLEEVPFIDAELTFLNHYSFLTRKPLVVVVNVGEEELALPAWDELNGSLARKKVAGIPVCAALEAEITSLDPSERMEFLEAVGLSLPAGHRLVQTIYGCLNLISFFTVGEDEVRAWPVRANSRAPVAAGRIHTDLQRGFIRAEVVSYDHFLDCGSLAAARRTGRLRTEGKDYIIQDGDIVNVLFNV